ncbi:MAG: hypothetical protein HPM95_08675 [Alphaproteobacteria bacterium]|nr:hypothetical protein [Alphaproteobacteria bacterium]
MPYDLEQHAGILGSRQCCGWLLFPGVRHADLAARRPAGGLCGIAGFKPSFDASRGRRGRSSWSLDTVGVFAKGIADVAGAGALADRETGVVDGEKSNPAER